MPTSFPQILMLGLGIALAFMGLLVARTRRGPGMHGLTVPTRIVIGLVFAIAGYHLIVWVFPPTLTPLQLNRQLWWVLPLAGIVAIVISVSMDRALKLSPNQGQPSPRDDGNAIR